MGWWIGAATVVSFVIYTTHSLPLVQMLFWLFIPSIYFYIGPCLRAAAQSGRTAHARRCFCAATLFAANFLNLIVAPVAVGCARDWLGPGHVENAESLRLAMLVPGAHGLVGDLSLLLVGARTSSPTRSGPPACGLRRPRPQHA